MAITAWTITAIHGVCDVRAEARGAAEEQTVGRHRVRDARPDEHVRVQAAEDRHEHDRRDEIAAARPEEHLARLEADGRVP